jgi:hypothetical protein
MPPRTVTVAIVVFWLGATAWLFVRDIWPELRPGERPPFTIDLSKEALGEKQRTRWGLHRNGLRIGYTDAWTTYDPLSQTYELNTRIIFEKDPQSEKERLRVSLLETSVEVSKMRSAYRVTPEGELRAVDARIELEVGSGNLRASDVAIQVQGEVQDGRFNPRWTINPPLLGLSDLGSTSIEVPAQESLFDPMRPWNRLLNVRPGQTWRPTHFDPLGEALSGMARKPAVRFLEAGVLQETDELPWDNQNVACLIIEYRSEDLTARTWVRQSDGLVLRQEAVKYPGRPKEDRLTLIREAK